MNAEEIQRAKTFVKKKTIIIGITLLLDLNVKCKSINLSEENIEENLHYLELDEEFLNMTPKPKYIKENINK